LKATRCETSYDSERKRLDGVLANIMKDLTEVESEVATVRRTSESDSCETDAALYTCQVICLACVGSASSSYKTWVMQVEHDACVRVCGDERLAVQNTMLAALDALMGHKQQVQDAFERLRGGAAAVDERRGAKE
jgi:hypothetical protein